MKIVRTDLCAGCGFTHGSLSMLEFFNSKQERQHLCADCVIGIAIGLEIPDHQLGAYHEAYASSVTRIGKSVMSTDAGP